MKQADRVVFLECHHGTESLFTRGLRSGAAAAGWESTVVFLADAAEKPRREKDVRRDLLRHAPTLVAFLMDAPLHLPGLWKDPRLEKLPKISFWFDDYYRSPQTLESPAIWTEWQQNHGVQVCIWDGYWRQQWETLTGAGAFPVHLAADPALLDKKAEPWNAAWSERAVFVGTIPAQKSLETSADSLPAPARHLLQEARLAMESAPWPIRPYTLAAACRLSLRPKLQAALDRFLEKPVSLAFWNHLLWRWGKRIARLRGLSTIAQAGPLAILSGHGTERYADEDDLRKKLPRGADWIYADTRSMPPVSWSRLFRSGKWQVQITDPQSISGGVPFRVFECAACGVSLLSDARPELTTLFPSGTGLITAPDEAGLGEAAARLFQASPQELEERGDLFHRHFLKENTWEKRWKQIVTQTLSREKAPEAVCAR